MFNTQDYFVVVFFVDLVFLFPKEKNALIVYLRSFYLTIGLADFENVISRTGFKSHVLHSLKKRAIFLHTCFYNISVINHLFSNY